MPKCSNAQNIRNCSSMVAWSNNPMKLSVGVKGPLAVRFSSMNMLSISWSVPLSVTPMCSCPDPFDVLVKVKNTNTLYHWCNGHSSLLPRLRLGNKATYINSYKLTSHGPSTNGLITRGDAFPLISVKGQVSVSCWGCPAARRQNRSMILQFCMQMPSSVVPLQQLPLANLFPGLLNDAICMEKK